MQSAATPTSSEGVRRRKNKKAKQRSSGEPNDVSGGDGTESVGKSPNYAEDIKGMMRFIWLCLGLGLLLYSGYSFAWYIRTLHENNMWFSHITEVEREISLRTESGLYYSYYKQLVRSNASFKEAVLELTRDNITEHGRTINILARFNVYQEVILAGAYKLMGFRETTDPLLFYVYSIFNLNGAYVMIIFGLAWYLTGMWPAGVLAALQFAINLDDATRVFFTINLRENFAFPFFWIQVFAICAFLDRKSGRARLHVSRCVILVCTFAFAICWQFNQFLLLLQAFTIYGMGVLHLAPRGKLQQILCLILIAMLAVSVCQFMQPMLLGSLIVSFVPAAVIMLFLWRNVALAGGILEGSFRIGCQVFFVLATTAAINFGIKQYVPVEADAHIFKFLKGKFGLGNPLDFESRVYLCHGAFVFLDNDFFYRASKSLLFPTYFITMLGFLFLMGKNLLLEWCTPVIPAELLGKKEEKRADDVSDKPFLLNERPYLAYLTIQSAFAGILALMTLRMKYFWTPHMVVLGSVALGDYEVWHSLLSFKKNKFRTPIIVNGIRYGLTFLLIGALLWRFIPTYRTQMNDLREFWDPDTVELMKWIESNTTTDASFGGSMQLLAGVKCCTGRHLTNHPHFEDKWLRERTKQVYQIYGRRSPEEVHRILHKIDAQYIILEDSICLARSDNCRTPDLVDIDNKMVPDNGVEAQGLHKSSTPRFCDEIRYRDLAYMKYFRLVMENRTFRVYKVL